MTAPDEIKDAIVSKIESDITYADNMAVQAQQAADEARMAADSWRALAAGLRKCFAALTGKDN